jgi:type IV pilus assembly protein PilM
VFVSIPLKSSLVTVISLPVVSGSRIDEMVNIEARRYIPVPISETLLDWRIIPGFGGAQEEEAESSEKQKTMHVLLVAIHKDTIEKYKRIIAKSNLELLNFEIEIFSIARSSLAREVSPLLIVDLGASVTKLAIVDHGMVRFVRTISKAAQDLTLALSHSLGVDFNQAEDIKRKIGLSSKPEHREFAATMEPVLDYIFSETSRTILEYQKKHSRAISRIVLTGGGALLAGLAEKAVKQFGVEVSVADPFSKTAYPAFLKNALQEAGPSFSAAVGLALCGLE